MNKRSLGEVVFTVVLWIVIGALVQWLMQSHFSAVITEPTEDATLPPLATYWNAMGLVALFFGVLAFWARDMMRENPLTKSLKVVASRLLSTTFDVGLFSLGGALFAVYGPGQAMLPMWQSVFMGVNFSLFAIMLVVLGVIWFLVKHSRLSLVNITALEFKPLPRVGIYVALLLLLILTAWWAL
ncbi:hypothetical protein [Larsenimonas suaedae]|uniref:Uncharacterized protein n=1 Tax=Larsenimonas suaedae TaxID=1851019 RepID=A0ABU1GTE0_9GAMM|nr:hypothetical protein [Larsenimonas suaedae]MCM2971726.1 hypothetical protein [Larsenimonas suaedae]MDR5895278.1 hypothetical protein [Larsenimonas suaedae]